MTNEHVVISSRVRLARNISGWFFPPRIRGTDSERELVAQILKVFERMGNFEIIKMCDASPLEKRSLVERYLISNNLAESSQSAVAISDDGAVSVMVSEEDHLREQAIIRGGDIEKAYKKILPIDGILRANLNFSVGADGYFTACPTNLGTGMRASVMLFLPMLFAEGAISEISALASKNGLVVRGALGEGSKPLGYVYQVSNEITLGKTENEIIKMVNDFVSYIVGRELDLEKTAYLSDTDYWDDRCLRSMGILYNCRLLDYGELSELISDVKLGTAFGVIKAKDVKMLDDLWVASRSATLRLYRDKGLSEERHRADFIRENVKKIQLHDTFND